MHAALLKLLRSLVVVLAFIVFGVIKLPPAFAASTIIVTTSSDEPALDALCSLREAVMAAYHNATFQDCPGGSYESPDTITFAPALRGTVITLREEIIIESSVTIEGLGVEDLTISGGGMTRVFTIRGSTITLRDLTIADGFSAENGGGMYVEDTTLTLDNVTFTNNVATLNGGGIYALRGSMRVYNSRFDDNTALGSYHNGTGGAISGGANVLISNSVFSHNTATGHYIGGQGGALRLGVSVNIENSLFIGNSAVGRSSEGGAIFGTATVQNSTFSGNSVTGSGSTGGAFRNTSFSEIINSTFSDNVAQGDLSSGGAISTGSDHPVNNQPHPAAIMRLQNSIISGGGCVNAGGSFEGSNNVATIGSNCPGATEYANLHLGVLGDNGGSTHTIALLPGSPAINAGRNDLAVDQWGRALTTDQRGVEFWRIINNLVDAGAYESNLVPQPNAPELISPTRMIESQPVSFSFNEVQYAGWYYLWVSGDSDHVVDQWFQAVDVCTDGICTVTPTVTYENDSYTWWVQAWGEAFGYTDWSAPMRFHILSEENSTP